MRTKVLIFLSVVMSAAFTLQAEEVTVYYDYVEDGQLRGGTVTLWQEPYNINMLSVFQSPWAVTTIVDNGPPSNRIDLVIVGDGYTEADLGDYYVHARQVSDLFFAEPPLSIYKSYFNIHRVDVISNESGVDEPDQEIYRDTALDMNYNCGGTARLLCINISKARQAASAAPETDQIMALANSTRYGGAGYPDLFTLSAGNSSAVNLALHEFGHSFGKLADEYHYSDGKVYTGGEPGQPNVSIYDATDQLSLETKWYRWLDDPSVDAFEGALYCQYGIYRPMNNSKMRSLSSSFGPVNNEQIILNVYRNVSLIDDATAASAVPLAGDTVFFVDHLRPAEDTIQVRWSIDGTEVAGATDDIFAPGALSLSAGVHEVAVKVVDATSRVRDEGIRDRWMTWSRQWTIDIAPTIPADLNRDYSVDILDLLIMSAQWLGQPGIPSADIAPQPDGDNFVDIADMAVLAEWWLWTVQ